MLSDRFCTAVEAGEVASATELFREDAVFLSPVVYRPYAGRDAVLNVLGAAERVLGLGGHFRYVHQLEDSDARVALLEFATEVDGRQVEGIDKLTVPRLPVRLVGEPALPHVVEASRSLLAAGRPARDDPFSGPARGRHRERCVVSARRGVRRRRSHHRAGRRDHPDCAVGRLRECLDGCLCRP